SPKQLNASNTRGQRRAAGPRTQHCARHWIHQAAPHRVSTQHLQALNSIVELYAEDEFVTLFLLLVCDVSEYLCGYESDRVSPDRLSVDEGNEGRKDAGPQRRVRTKFSSEQIKKLERIFIKQKYLDSGEREKTAQKLNLTETQVRTWFQNRRMKLKREFQDYLTPPVPPVIFQPLSPVQYHSMAGHLPHYSPTGHPFYSLPVPQLLHHQHMPPHYPHRTMIHHPHFY
uniref:Ventral homeobox n=1 Tax=Haplochromis burtoni TaxID=8153 RepID=A0A3Q3BNP6_HAPBU